MGVTSGASVPELLVRDVLTHLADRGYADVAPVVAAQESLLFSLPNEIRRDLKARGISDEVRHDGAFEEPTRCTESALRLSADTGRGSRGYRLTHDRPDQCAELG